MKNPVSVLVLSASDSIPAVKFHVRQESRLRRREHLPPMINLVKERNALKTKEFVSF